MSTYQYGKKWRADIHIKGMKVAAQSGFNSKEEAQAWHDKEKQRIKSLSKPTESKKSENGFALSIERNFIDDSKNQTLSNLYNQISFDDLWERFKILHLPTIRKSTQDRYILDVEYRIRPFFKNYPLDQISQIIIESFKINLLQRLSPKSSNNCLALLKMILKRGVQWGMIKESPAQHVELHKLAERKYDWWQHKEDIMKFLSVAKNDPYYLAYRLGLDCGLRLGEIVGLSKKDINLNQGQIHIHRQWLEKEKRYGATKHGKERYIGVSKNSELYHLLEKALLVRPESEALFFTRLGNRISCRKLSGYYFQKLIEKSGVPRIRFHDLRHTFASWYMITTDNIWDLKYLLGHADIQTTQRYAHLSSKKRFSPNFEWEE
ncbi:MAG: site-specific integrase [Gammaproteobacteria bacterium]|nr:site-specific integrase [Gammaproteobacteria bacterium]